MSKNKPSISKKLIVGNWKMNPETLETAKKLASDIKKELPESKRALLSYAPLLFFFSEVRGKLSSPKIRFGLQNVHYEKSGPYTGEISGSMAKNVKAEFVIIGHSERRAMGETDEQISKKMHAAIKCGMTPILCVGEKEIDENATHLEFIKDQLAKCLDKIDSQEIQSIIVAYEPVYAIGGKYPVDSHQIHQRNIFIKKVLTEKYGKEKAFSVPVLYGGSATPDSAKEIIRDGSVDGLLIGHESLKADDFVEIVNRIESL